MIKVIEFFAGIGAYHQALKELEIPHEIVGISEIDNQAISAYQELHGQVNSLGDIREIKELPYADMWCYSFPCTDNFIVVENVSNKKNHLNIRKLTPLESWRLMGWSDEDFEKVKNFSNTTLYRLAGNSVVVPVLKEIFRTLFIDKCEVDLDYYKQLKMF